MTESEIHSLITSTIDTLRDDFREQSALDRKDYRERTANLETKLEALRGCFVSRSACQQCHQAVQRACDERHEQVDKRIVDKTYFAGGVGVLLFVIAVAGVVLGIVRF